VRRIYIASPFNGETVEEIRQNIIYGRLAMLDSLARGEAPYLSHLLYTQVWAETPELRERGLAAGDAWRVVCEGVALYVDLGLTSGMQRAKAYAEGRLETMSCESRTLDDVIGRGGPAGAASPEEWRAYLATIPLRTFPALEVR
jgi:hypothetical protein